MARMRILRACTAALGWVWLVAASPGPGLANAIDRSDTVALEAALAPLFPAGPPSQPVVGTSSAARLPAFVDAARAGRAGDDLVPAVSTAQWRQFYHEIREAPFFARDWPRATELRRRALGEERAGAIAVALLDVGFLRPTAQARQAREGSSGSGDAGDAATLGEGAFVAERIFAAAALTDHTHNGERVTFRFAAPLYFTDRDGSLPDLEVDFADGSGPRSVGFDEPITVGYRSIGSKTVTVRAISPRDEVTEARFLFEVKRLVTPEPDATWTVTADIPYEGGLGSGLAYVYLAEGHATLTNPVLVIEGFDIANTTNWEELYELMSAEDLLETLRGEGFDFVALNFDDSNEYIQRHAFLTVALIQRINAETPPDAELAVVGASMGGLVGRYALAYMEQNGLTHNARIFLAFDSPHKGAVIPLGLQHWVDFFAIESEEAAFLRDALNRPSPRQMLIYQYAASPSGGAASDPLRAVMEDELTALGRYPTIPRNVAVANGSGSQQDQGYAPGDQIVLYEYYSFLVDIIGNVWALPDQSSHVIFDGLIDRIWPLPDDQRTVTVANTLPYDTAPGGQRPSMAQLDTTEVPYGDLIALQDDHCFIPTISSLDLDTDDLFYDVAGDPDIMALTPFDAIYYPAENEEHNIVTPANAQWIADEVRGTVTAVAEDTPSAATGLASLEVHPNPFNPRTTVIFAVGRSQSVEVAVYDLTGRRIDTVVSGRYEAGEHRVAWDGRDAGGHAVPSGVYFLRARLGDEVVSRKVALLR